MTFDLRVTRREHWMEPCADDIDEQEWRAIVAGEPDLELLGRAEDLDHRGNRIAFTSPNLAAWRAHPAGESVWLDFAEGSVIVADPDPPTVRLLQRLAERLGGRVQDNDGKEYR